MTSLLTVSLSRDLIFSTSSAIFDAIFEIYLKFRSSDCIFSRIKTSQAVHASTARVQYKGLGPFMVFVFA